MTEGVLGAMVRADLEDVLNALETMDKVKPLGDLVYENVAGGWTGNEDPDGYKDAVARIVVVLGKYRNCTKAA